MDAKPENPSEEVKGLQRCLNDLLSVQALPALWVGSGQSQIIRAALEVLPNMLQLDLVYFYLGNAGGYPPMEAAHTSPLAGLVGTPSIIGQALRDGLGADPRMWTDSSRKMIGDEELSLLPIPLGLQGDIGMLVAGSRRPDFPLQTEKLLLGVAANQIAIGLHEARLLSEQTRIAHELDRRVLQRTSELAASNEELKRSEARKTAILDSALDCIITIDHEARITEFNPAAERTFGHRRDQVLGKALADVIIPQEFRERHSQGFSRYLSTGEAHVLGRRLEMTAQRADGSEFPVELAITRIAGDGPPSFTGYLRDITERKKSEGKLRRSEAYLAEAQRLSHTGSFGWKVATGEITWSEETFRIFDVAPTTKPTLELIFSRVHPEDALNVRELIARAVRDGMDFVCEHRLVIPNGAVKHVRVVAHAERAESGQIEFVGAVMDVTAAKVTEAGLRASAAIAQSLVALRSEISAALSKQVAAREILQECAEAMVRHVGVAFVRIWTLNQKEDVLELQASAGAYTRLDGTHSRINVGSLKVGTIAKDQKPHFTNDVLNDPRIGDPAWARSCGFVSFAGFPLVVDGQTVGVLAMFAKHALSDTATGALASVADAIAQGLRRKQKEDELRRAEAYLSEGQRLSHTGSWAWKVKSREIIFWSKELFSIYGFNPGVDLAQYAAARNLVHPEDVLAYDGQIDLAIQARSDFEIHHRIVLPGGTIKHLHILGHPVFAPSGEVVEYTGTVMDVTEVLLAEEALRKAQANLAHMARLTTVGELTASIAHEVNQPLAAVVTNANACLRWLEHEPANLEEVRAAIHRIVRDGNRGSDVIRGIRGLVKKDHSEWADLDLNELIRETIAIAGLDLRGTALQTDMADDLPVIHADRIQLQQVLLNLALNALDAMRLVADRPHLLRIQTRSQEEGVIWVAVEDSGIGLKAKEMDKLFEKFYTTKPDGLGMGLPICRSIIEAHGGRLWADSMTGRGSRFQFVLPTQPKNDP